MRAVIYKIVINLVPILRGFIMSIVYRTIRRNVHINIKSRIKGYTEWILNPGCVFYSDEGFLVGKFTTMNVAKNGILTIGKNVGIGNRCQIVCHKHIEIGDGTIFGPSVLIYDHNHLFDFDKGVNQRQFVSDDIIIGKHCWIGAGCIILKGVTIGDNCLIGAGSIVTKDIPSGSMAVGSPAHIIKSKNGTT